MKRWMMCGLALILCFCAWADDSTQTAAARLIKPDSSLADLPIQLILPDSGNAEFMTVFLSGDGGWSSFDNEISHRLAKTGVPVVGWNSLKYFWSKRTPESAANDLARILQFYRKAWHKSRALVVGYSFGADVMPFMVNRMPDSVRAMVDCVGLISPSHHADFEFHVTTWLGKSHNKTSLPVVPEVLKLKAEHPLIFYGADEEDTITADLPPDLATIVTMKGGHHMDRDYDGIVKNILAAMKP